MEEAVENAIVADDDDGDDDLADISHIRNVLSWLALARR